MENMRQPCESAPLQLPPQSHDLQLQLFPVGFTDTLAAGEPVAVQRRRQRIVRHTRSQAVRAWGLGFTMSIGV